MRGNAKRKKKKLRDAQLQKSECRLEAAEKGIQKLKAHLETAHRDLVNSEKEVAGLNPKNDMRKERKKERKNRRRRRHCNNKVDNNSQPVTYLQCL